MSIDQVLKKIVKDSMGELEIDHDALYAPDSASYQQLSCEW